MKSIVRNAPLVLGIFLAAACGKVNEAGKSIKNSVEAPNLMKTWASTCAGSSVLNKVGGLPYERTYVEFSGNKVSQLHEFYDSSDCNKSAVAQVKYEGTFDLEGETPAQDGRFLNLQFQSVAIKPLTKDLADKMGAVSLCGHDAWTEGQAQNITGESDRALCPVKRMPRNEYNLYSVDNNNIYFGAIELGNSVDRADKRPTKVDRTKTYTAVERDLK